MSGGFRGGDENGSWKRRGTRMLDESPADEARREVAFHIGMKTEELVAKGWSRAKARAEAERQFGNASEVEAECAQIASRHRRSRWRAWQLETLRSDVRFGLRMLARRPGFTIVAVLTLALGIGANAAVFSVIQNLLLEPLPYPSQSGIVELHEVTASGASNPVAEPNYFDWKREARSFEAMATIQGPGDEPILGGAEPVRRPLTIVSGEFFGIMGMAPFAGRLPAAGEVTRGAAPVAVVSHRFWSSVLRGEKDLSRASLSVMGFAAPVTAVMPPGFDYPIGTDVWVVRYPMAGGTRTSHNYEVIARLADAVSLEAARSEMATIGARLANVYAGEIDAQSVRVETIAEALYGSYRQPLMLLFAAAATVLLVACTNLASSLLARGASREREVAVRVSVGAGRLRVTRQFLTESLMLALLAGGAGLALAAVLLRVLQSIDPSGVLRMRELSIGVPTFVFTMLAAILAAGLFGVLPALKSSGVDVATLLRGGDRGGSGRRARLWDVLVAGEVALALVLLAASGLLIRSFRVLVDVEQGFDVSGIIAVDVFVPRQVAATDTMVAQLETRLLEELRALPEVASAGLVSALPGTSFLNGGVDIERATEPGYAEYRVAEEGYFEALRIPLERGRLFGVEDQLGTETVALVDETFANRYFPGEDPVGRRLSNLRNDSFHYGTDAMLTIIGVVGSVLPRGQMRGADATVYVLHRQRAFRSRGATIAIRARSASHNLNAGIRDVVTRLAPDVPYDIGNAATSISAPLAGRRFAMFVVAGFGGLTLLLAAVGIHGVVTWSVQQRTREMGIRIALGAMPSGVAGSVVGDAMRVVAVGLGLGLLISVAAARLIGGFLVGTSPVQPLTLAFVTALLAGVAVLASGLPAVRVARIDPVASLRSD